MQVGTTLKQIINKTIVSHISLYTYYSSTSV